VLTRLLLPVACAALTLAACATMRSAQRPPAASADKPPAGCVAQTATHIEVKNNDCAGFGATYTNQDLLNTGRLYPDQALRMLDPSVQTTGAGR
jgi:hypothetical protein